MNKILQFSKNNSKNLFFDFDRSPKFPQGPWGPREPQGPHKNEFLEKSENYRKIEFLKGQHFVIPSVPAQWLAKLAVCVAHALG